MGIYEELEWRGLIKDISSPELREKLNHWLAGDEARQRKDHDC